MGLVSGVWLAVLGILGASNLIIARKPDAKDLIDKLAPFQGWIGAISALWGAWTLISMVLGLGLLATYPIYWISMVAAGAVQLVLGFILGIGVLKTFIKNPSAQLKMDRTLTRVAPYSGTLGLASIGVGVWVVIAGFVFYL